MYSNSKKGFSILDLLVKIIFAGLFIFILIWLFNKKIPNINMKPFYSNVFRENIKYMQDAGEAYFTDEKMPTEVGESVSVALAEMEANNLVLPFVDENGNPCDKNNSYVSITKMAEGYELKTNLVCDKESNYVIKPLGCHTYCKNGNCSKNCKLSTITKYQHKKLVNGNKTNYSCGKGFTLSGKYCTKTKLVETVDATKTDSKTTRVTAAAKVNQGSAKLQQLSTVVTNKDVQVSTVVTPKDTLLTTNVTTKDVQLTTVITPNSTETQLSVVTENVPAVTRQDRQPYDCTKYRTKTNCTTSYRQDAYSCNCKTTTSRGRSTTTCSTCYESVPVTTCKDYNEPYTDTCYRTVTITVSNAYTKYSCPSGTTRSTGSGSSLRCYKGSTSYTYSCPNGTTKSTGSGSSLKCYRTEKVYTCPNGTTKQTGSGSSLKCYKTENTYSCPNGTTKQTGSGSSLKCYKTEKVYSCPSGTDVKEGSGSSLKCYKTIAGTVTYSCDNGYKLDSTGKSCYKDVTTTTITKECPKGFKLEKGKCNRYTTTKVKAKATKTTTSYYIYKWSKKEYLEGYTATGKTKTSKGKEIVCE